MARVLAAILGLWMCAIASAEAGEGPVLVELFSSQGCSSCPPADRLLGELADRPDVVALSFHVDYWDYIGWKDRFADPSFSQRQRNYARALGQGSVYTPQIIVGGQHAIPGAKAMRLAELISRHAARPDEARVTLTRRGDRVAVSVASGPAGGRPGLVLLTTLLSRADVDISRGENAGRRLTYHNVVRGLVPLGSWDGRSRFTASVRVGQGTPVAVFVQSEGYGPVLGAAKLD